jgi:phosphatidylglycerol lysyltransferase
MLPPAEGLTFLRFVGIYLAAYAAGIAAHVPGGLGVFDGAIMLGLAPYLGAAEAVGALLVFRLFYYIIPLFIAGFLFAGFELGQRRGLLGRFSAASAGAMPLEVPVLSGLVALGGGLLIFLGALPVRSSPLLVWLGPWAALASQFAASLVGSLLLVMAFGLARRLTLAWGAALVLLGFGALIALLRDEEWWIIAAFPLVMAFLGTMRAAFYRDSRLRLEPLSTQMLLPLIAVASCGVTLAMVAHAGRVANISWWEVVLLPYAPPQLRFTVGLAALLLLVGVVRLLRPARIRPQPYDAAMRERLRALHGRVPPAGDAVLWGEADRAALVFTRGEAIWMGQGDPLGDPLGANGEDRRDAVSAIWRFRDLCERNGVRPAFLDVGEAYGRVYADIGLQVVPDPAHPGRRIACMAELDLDALTPPLAA